MAGSNVLGKALTTTPAGPSNATLSGTFGADADFSGFNVNFGNGNIDSQATKTKTDTATPTLGGGAPLVGGSLDMTTMALVALGIVGLWAALR